MAITTPLFKVFEYRRYLIDFSFNLKLHQYIRESYNKKISTSASKSQPPLEYSASSLNLSETTLSPSATTQIALPATPRVSAPLSADQVTPRAPATRVTPLLVSQVTSQIALLAYQITPQAVTSRLDTSRLATSSSTYRVISPSIYRAVSPLSSIYEIKNYLIMADLYMRYAPLKSVKFIDSASKSVLKLISYLTMEDLYKRFKRSVVFAAK